MPTSERNEAPTTPDHVSMGIDWESLFTAKTRKGVNAQFVNQIHLGSPERAIMKSVFNARNTEGIRNALHSGLDEGFSMGVATCYYQTSAMEGAPYWAGRTGIHSTEDIEPFLLGDPNWDHFGSRIPEKQRRKYPWIPLGLNGLNKTSNGPIETVINHHPKNYGLNPENHFVAHLYRPSPTKNNPIRALEIYVAPDTINTRALGGELNRSKILHIFLPYGKILENQPIPVACILTAGVEHFTPEAKSAIDDVILAIRSSYLAAKEHIVPMQALAAGGVTADYAERTGQKLAFLTDTHLQDKISHQPTSIPYLEHILTDREISTILSEAIGLSGAFHKAALGQLESTEAVMAINHAIKTNRDYRNWISFIISPFLYRDFLKPKAAAIVNQVLDRLFQKDSQELWTEILDVVDGPLNDRFAPVLEFIGSPLQLYEVKEKARR